VSWRHVTARPSQPGGGRSHRLLVHPSTPSDAVRSLTVDVARTPSILALRYLLHADLDRLAIPPPGPIRSGRDLWRHTCFEAFLGIDGEAPYHEVNLSPSRQWALYAFRARRDGGVVDEPGWRPDLHVHRDADALEVRATLPLDALASAYATATLRLALSAVLEARDGTQSYWALHHPPGTPDFHHPEAFALRLEPPAAGC